MKTFRLNQPQLFNTLNAMYLTFSPYLDYETIKYEWIKDLIHAYNSVVISANEQDIFIDNHIIISHGEI